MSRFIPLLLLVAVADMAVTVTVTVAGAEVIPPSLAGVPPIALPMLRLTHPSRSLKRPMSMAE